MGFGFKKVAVFSAIFGAGAISAFAAADYPVQEFRFGIGNTDRNITISGKNAGDYLSSATIKGADDEKWSLNYISAGVYEIVNSATGMVVTNENGLATLAKDTDGANQRWKIEAIEKDFDGYNLYYKVVSNADPTQALTFDINSNSIAVDDYAKGDYQKFKLNLDGLEGYAANAMTPKGEKAGTIGGLLGEVVYVSDADNLEKQLNSKGAQTIVITADIDMQKKSNTRVRDNKTIVGQYGKHTIYDCQFRTNDAWGTAGEVPSDNIIFRNLKMVAKNVPNRILINIWSSRQIWIDHIYFESQLNYDRTGNGQDEVGKFIWINTPYANYRDSADRYRSPDYVTISYSHLKNRYWTVAYGTQNDEITRDRTTLLYNWWEKNVRRCPQLGNGAAHVYNNYFSAYGKSSNGSGTSGIIGGDGSEMLSSNNRFNGYTKSQALMMGGGTDPARDDNSYLSEALDATPAKVSFSPKKASTWKPEQSNYGYSLLDAYNTKGTDVKDFCSKYAGDQTSASNMKYITDSEFDSWANVRYPAPFLKSITVGDEPVGGLKEGAVLDVTKKFAIKNVNSGLYLGLSEGETASGLDVIQGKAETGWTFVAATSDAVETQSDADNGYYYIHLVKDSAFILNLSSGSKDNGANIELWEDVANASQQFKFVQNEDKTYSITTKNTKDKSCLGIGAGSKEENASVIQWACDGTDNQKWTLEEYKEPKPSDSSETDTPQAIATALSLNAASNTPIQISLYDLSGKRLMQTQMQHGVSTKELRRFVPKGIYILKVNGIGLQKIMRVNVQ
ncbi:MAG: RICIN domain-containing protein [Fibrobacter sp.]|nr:RICIN domain-containing protein [Fibrobacter sp.]